MNGNAFFALYVPNVTTLDWPVDIAESIRDRSGQFEIDAN